MSGMNDEGRLENQENTNHSNADQTGNDATISTDAEKPLFSNMTFEEL